MKTGQGILWTLAASAVLVTACGKSAPTAPAADGTGSGSGAAAAPTAALAGEVQIDGSSTVLPISEAVAEEFQKGGQVKVTVGGSGTGGGFQKFCNGEIDVAGASRPIKKNEIEACAAKGIEFIEVPIAYDAISVVVNPQNSWVDSMTVAELKKLWEPEAQGVVKKWSEVRAGWPDDEIRLFGPGVDSGTYDYFTKAIVGKEHSSRGDYTSSEDDNVVVQGVSTDKLALGFFGFAYYEENAQKLRIVPIDDSKPENGNGGVAPTKETVLAGTYQPLSRPVFIYLSARSLQRPEVAAFGEFYVKNAGRLAGEVGYIPLPDAAYGTILGHVTGRKTGTLFADGSAVGLTVEALIAIERGQPGGAPPSAGSGAAAPAGNGSGAPSAGSGAAAPAGR
jgi:phosphate transport system substrate-binding protein